MTIAAFPAFAPVQITMLKGLVAGIVNTALALLLGAKLPALPVILSTGLIGLFGYGISLVLLVLALRHVGSARTGAYFSTAPFVGAAILMAFLGDSLTVGFLVAATFMGAGVWLHLTERHEHEHSHEGVEHEHAHVHDDHHRHPHEQTDPTGEPHSHRHHHAALAHSHPQYPDIHHRHSH